MIYLILLFILVVIISASFKIQQFKQFVQQLLTYKSVSSNILIRLVQPDTIVRYLQFIIENKQKPTETDFEEILDPQLTKFTNIYFIVAFVVLIILSLAHPTRFVATFVSNTIMYIIKVSKNNNLTILEDTFYTIGLYILTDYLTGKQPTLNVYLLLTIKKLLGLIILQVINFSSDNLINVQITSHSIYLLLNFTINLAKNVIQQIKKVDFKGLMIYIAQQFKSLQEKITQQDIANMTQANVSSLVNSEISDVNYNN